MARPYSYASFADVRALLPILPSVLPASYRPNASQVDFFIQRAANELDAVLGQANYDVPIPTGATLAHELLRTYVAIGGAWQAAFAMPQGRDSKHAETYREEWNAILTGIRGKEIELPGVDHRSTAGRARWPATDPAGAGASPFFTRDQVEDL